jgi:hypothetical protein
VTDIKNVVVEGLDLGGAFQDKIDEEIKKQTGKGFRDGAVDAAVAKM